MEWKKMPTTNHGSSPFVPCLIAVLTVLCCGQIVAAAQVTDLRCEYLRDPLGVDTPKPRLSWVFESLERGQKQSAYRILVAQSEEKLDADQGDLWDSGKVESDQTIQVVYSGRSLTSRMRCCWKVRVWDKDGTPSSWSKPALWSMGLLQPSDWTAQWIAHEGPAQSRSPHNGYHSDFANSADATKWVAVDLGQSRPIDAVRLFPARPFDYQDTPGFLFPVRFRIEVAQQADFSDARTVVDRTAEDLANPGDDALVYPFAPVQARHVRVTATKLRRRDGNNFGLALAEMYVLAGEKNVAQGAAVTALDSIDTEAWSKAKLVDGRAKADAGGVELRPATMMRKSFTVDGPVRRATAYVTGLGLYELHLNGKRVGDHILAPEYTVYDKRVQYQTFDVTDLLVSGDNALGALLGDGWYAGRFFGSPAPSDRPFHGQRGLILRLDIELTGGKTQTIVTDGSWRCTSDGPIRSDSIYDGEVYDARKEMPGWDRSGFDDSRWHAVHIVQDLARVNLVWQRNEPIRVVQERKPVNATEPKPGVHVFDLGQNMVGWCRLKVRGPAGSTVRLRHAEMLNDDGTIYTDNIRGADQMETYTKRTDGEEVYEPRFTYHGFRYVELTGVSYRPTAADIVGRVFYSAAPDAGQFECSNELVNQIMHMIVWVQRGNMHSIPTDCPQRNERAGWMGDIQAFGQTAIFNMDMAGFFSKWIPDVRDSQAKDGRYPNFAPMYEDTWSGGTPAWADAGTVVPWRMYENYADTRLLEEHFESARRWVDFVHSKNPNMLWENELGSKYNDWLNGDTIIMNGWPRTGGAVPPHVLATAFFAHSTEIVAKMAAVIGRKDEALKYARMFEDIKTAFNKKYVNADGRIEGDTQAGYALALNFNLLPAGLRPNAAQHMVEGFKRYDAHMSTGIQTTHRLMLELTRNGYNDEAYRLLCLRTFPSWGFMVEQGATTIWERWDGYVKGRGFQNAGMNSFNHWALGSVGEWMWRNIIGINPDEEYPAYKRFTIRPRPGGGLEWAKGTYESIRGPIAIDWRIADGVFTLNATVPANTTATVYLPTTNPESVTEGGNEPAQAKGITFLRVEDGNAVFAVESGRYVFASEWRP
ncbi:MAG: family 78 glycoside hydrolase catalytic domain [Phycisphaerae bacterium]|nr:family 78 glycoside hydrolase catalytic domain [Phycisphaerae bacterium]